MRKSYKKERKRKNKLEAVENKNEIKSFAIILSIVFASFGLVYFLTIGLSDMGYFDAGYTPREVAATEISYEYISIGTVFNRVEDEYYVIFDDYESLNYDMYIDSLATSSSKKIYKVNMGKGINKNYADDSSNKKAQKPKDLNINGITLIKVLRGKNVMYIEGSENVIKYLEKLK